MRNGGFGARHTKPEAAGAGCRRKTGWRGSFCADLHVNAWAFSSPAPAQARPTITVFVLPFFEPAACAPPPPPTPPAAAILRTLTTMVAHFLGAFPPLQRTDLVAAVKSRVNLRLNKTGSFELRLLVKRSVGLRSGNGDLIFSSGGWFLFSFSSFERGFWLWGGELQPWASLRLGRLPRRTRAGAALLSRFGPCRARPLPTPLPPPARALPARPGLPGLGGGAGAEPAPRLGISYHAAALVFWRFFPPLLLEC